jgi:hypothetical protein
MIPNATGGVKEFSSCSLIGGGAILPRTHMGSPSVPLIWWVVWLDRTAGDWEMGVSTFFSFHFSKIFILNDLSGMDPAGSVQNLEPQGLTAKIFHNKDLAWKHSLHIFFVKVTKILILNDLGSLDRSSSGQNIEPQ